MVFGFFKKSAGDKSKDKADAVVSESTTEAPLESRPSEVADVEPVVVEAVAAETPSPTQTNETPPGKMEADERYEAFMSPVTEELQAEHRKGLFSRMAAGLAKTSSQLTSELGNIFMGLKELDDELLEELETQLLLADVGIEAVEVIVSSLAEKVERNELASTQALYQALQDELVTLLEPAQSPLMIDNHKTPFVILVVGVNGVGKTTTIGKLAKGFQAQGKQVMLAAGDTFRAAAVEQLQVWGDRNNVPVVAQHTGADSASVIFDAVQSAKSRGVDILIADTAGRLHNKSNLMEELTKIKRVMAKLDDSAPHEVLLVLDAGTGQNAINQAQQFSAAAGVTGLALTKLDGTAKGGVIFALAKQLKLPVRFIGVGEGVDDLQPFEAKSFVKALFAGVEGAE